jgi:hypothetical protein
MTGAGANGLFVLSLQAAITKAERAVMTLVTRNRLMGCLVFIERCDPENLRPENRETEANPHFS